MKEHAKPRPGEREQRLGAALRENLRKRKEQARARSTAAPDSSEGEHASAPSARQLTGLPSRKD